MFLLNLGMSCEAIAEQKIAKEIARYRKMKFDIESSFLLGMLKYVTSILYQSSRDCSSFAISSQISGVMHPG